MNKNEWCKMCGDEIKKGCSLCSIKSDGEQPSNFWGKQVVKFPSVCMSCEEEPNSKPCCTCEIKDWESYPTNFKSNKDFQEQIDWKRMYEEAKIENAMLKGENERMKTVSTNLAIMVDKLIEQVKVIRGIISVISGQNFDDVMTKFNQEGK